MERMRYYKKEHFVSLMLNAKGEIIEEANISVGDLCSSTTHPREVFVDAVRRSAGSVVFLHNHPSGDPEPSEADVETTVRLMEARCDPGDPGTGSHCDRGWELCEYESKRYDIVDSSRKTFET